MFYEFILLWFKSCTITQSIELRTHTHSLFVVSVGRPEKSGAVFLCLNGRMVYLGNLKIFCTWPLAGLTHKHTHTEYKWKKVVDEWAKWNGSGHGTHDRCTYFVFRLNVSAWAFPSESKHDCYKWWTTMCSWRQTKHKQTFHYDGSNSALHSTCSKYIYMNRCSKCALHVWLLWWRTHVRSSHGIFLLLFIQTVWQSVYCQINWALVLSILAW